MLEPAIKPRIVVGLGNPGPRYESTRHNVGRMVTAALIQRVGSARVESHSLVEVAHTVVHGAPVLVAAPRTYMNESGRAVAFVARQAGVPPAEILVVHDELDLPFGSLRLKLGGGAGGHRGLSSVTDCLGSADYARLRIGIGRPEATFVGTVADFVLEAVPLADRPALESSVGRAVEATMLSVESGLAAAMNVVNQRNPR